MREIEVKYRVDDLEALQAALKAHGVKLGDPVYQDDQAYAPATWQFGDSKLEVERLAPDDADEHAIQAELAAFVDSLGITASRTTDTYDSLVHAALTFIRLVRTKLPTQRTGRRGQSTQLGPRRPPGISGLSSRRRQEAPHR